MAKMTGDARGEFIVTYLAKGYTLKELAPIIEISYGQLLRWWRKHKHNYLDEDLSRPVARSTPAPPRSFTQRAAPHPLHSSEPHSSAEPLSESSLDLEDFLKQPRKLNHQFIRNGLFLLSQGSLTPNEYAAISRELRYWREHETKYGALDEDPEVINLDPAEVEYLLSQVEEVFCSACPFRQSAITSAAHDQKKARILPSESPSLGR